MITVSVPREVERIARELNLPLEGLVERGVRAFLKQELRVVQMDLADLQDRYDVETAAELREHIEQGKVYSHPAWEDAIEWERLEAYQERLERILSEM